MDSKIIIMSTSGTPAATKPAATKTATTSPTSGTAPTTTTVTTPTTEASKGTAKPRVRAPRAKVSKAVDPKVICEQFAKQVMDRYQLDDSVMNSMSDVVLAVLNNYHVYSEQQTQVSSTDDAVAPKGKKADGPKKPRKSSAYNVYVKEMMQDPQVKEVPQKEKMSIIGNMWKGLSEEGRASYQARADEVNAHLGEDAVTETSTQV